MVVVEVDAVAESVVDVVVEGVDEGMADVVVVDVVDVVVLVVPVDAGVDVVTLEEIVVDGFEVVKSGIGSGVVVALMRASFWDSYRLGMSVRSCPRL